MHVLLACHRRGLVGSVRTLVKALLPVSFFTAANAALKAVCRTANAEALQHAKRHAHHHMQARRVADVQRDSAMYWAEHGLNLTAEGSSFESLKAALVTVSHRQ